MVFRSSAPTARKPRGSYLHWPRCASVARLLSHLLIMTARRRVQGSQISVSRTNHFSHVSQNTTPPIQALTLSLDFVALLLVRLSIAFPPTSSLTIAVGCNSGSTVFQSQVGQTISALRKDREDRQFWSFYLRFAPSP